MSSNNRTRAHHYVPQFYLGHFTDTGTRDGFLWVHNLQDRRSFRTKPAGIAHERDFYMLELQNNDPLEIEHMFGEQESLASPIIRKLIDGQTIDQHEFKFLAGFIFLLLVRGPRVRMADAFAVQQRIDPTTLPSFPQNWHMLNLTQNYFTNAEAVADWLITLDWLLINPLHGSGEFICTDNPVVLQQTANGGLELYMPLSPQIVIKANLENSSGNIAGADADAIQVATINRIFLGECNRFVFSMQNNFCWIKDDQSIGNVQDVFNILQRSQVPNASPDDPTASEPSSPKNSEVW